ncbi:hypothetical protein HYZ64_00955 [Candidatus Berkelbacteria bacterium]|nr:hypothetical protein [Candidatus Berkelbacteria bacterium]
MKTEQELSAEYQQMETESRIIGAIETGQNGSRFNFHKYVEKFYQGIGPDQSAKRPLIDNNLPSAIEKLDQRAFDDWQYIERNRPGLKHELKGWAAEWLLLRSLSERYGDGLKFEKHTDSYTDSRGEDIRIQLPFGDQKRWFRFDITVSDETALHKKQDRAAGEIKFLREPLETVLPLPIGKLMQDNQRFVQLHNYRNLRTNFAEYLIEQYIPEILLNNLGPHLAKDKLDLKRMGSLAHMIPQPRR